jgi:hypothetical protein
MIRVLPLLLLSLSGCDHRAGVAGGDATVADGGATIVPEGGAGSIPDPPAGQALAAFCSGGSPRAMVDGAEVEVTRVEHLWDDIPCLGIEAGPYRVEVDLDTSGAQIPPVPSTYDIEKMALIWDTQVFVYSCAPSCDNEIVGTDPLAQPQGDAVSGWVRFSPTTAAQTFAVATTCVVARRGERHPPPVFYDAGVSFEAQPRVGWVAIYAPNVALSYP